MKPKYLVEYKMTKLGEEAYSNPKCRSSANRFRSDIMNHARSSTIYKLVPVEEKKAKENR